MAKQPLVTFIICTYNRAQYLDETLQSILQHAQHGLNAELLVVDNNSSDQTNHVVQQTQANDENIAIRYIKEQQQGLSHARNRGIQTANAPYVVFLDDDIRASETLITAWIQFFTDHPEAKAAGGKIHVQFDDPRPKWMSHFLLPLLGYHDLGDTTKKYPKNKYPFGGNMGFKKELFNTTGSFNVELGRRGQSLEAGEEKELFQRIRSQKYDIYYIPEAYLYHRVNSSRLTLDYIKQQALGLGKSMKRQMKHVSFNQKLLNGLTEAGKWIVSIPLALVYLLIFNPSKAITLFKFRWWIWMGYFK